MSKVHPLLNAALLLHDLQRVNEIAQSLSGNLNPRVTANQVTEALVDDFGCAFARIWLVEADQKALRLVASSGLYTHIDGSFARVPMGAYKVGKIAQNRVPFLSNRLPEETWVKDRQWAIDNRIQGFAGYPLMTKDRVLGVLATFSHSPFAPEFLEVLQVLCMTVAVALDAALQADPAGSHLGRPQTAKLPLSDQISQILGETQLMLVGTERPLPTAFVSSFLHMAELLAYLGCSYCRLSYSPVEIALEAIVKTAPDCPDTAECDALHKPWPDMRSHYDHLKMLSSCLGGTLQSQPVGGRAHQMTLRLPYVDGDAPWVQIRCRHPVLQQAFTQLAYQARLRICESPALAALVLTDYIFPNEATPVIWIRHDHRPIPDQVANVLDLTTTAERLRQQVEQVLYNADSMTQDPSPTLSGREQQIMKLLAEGKRDRNIAQELYISESTVKFHINNCLAKLSAKNRYQGVYQAALRGWI